MNLECTICLENVFIPVELLTFPCSKNNRINCYSFHRICEKCAIHFLELDKQNSDRKKEIKCLFCDEKINPQLLTQKPYKKDFLLMSMDNKIYNCQYCEFKGKHLEMNNHLETVCMNYPLECLCGIKDKRVVILSDEHKITCSFYKMCFVCQSLFPVHEFNNHLLTIHSMYECNVCGKPTIKDILDHIQNECSHRIIHCNHCSSNVIAYTYLDHLIDHTRDCKIRIELIKDIMAKELEIYHRYKIEIENLYESIYGASLNLN